MPISAKEKAKVERHTPSETIDKDMMYSTPGRFSVSEALRNGVSIFSKNARYLPLGIPDTLAVIITLYALAMLSGFTFAVSANFQDLFSHGPYIFEILAAFFLYFTFISAPLSSLYKSRIAGIKYPGTLKAIACSLSTMQPLCYTLFLAGTALTFNIIITGWFGPSALILGAILYLTSINQSILPYFLADTKNNRSAAINRGWLLLSNSSLKLLAINLVIFLPTIVLLALFIATQNLYVLAPMAVLFLLSEGIWYGATFSIYKAVSKVKNNYKIA